MKYILFTIAGILSLPSISYAVLPPDLVVSVGSQVAGFFGLFFAILAGFIASTGMLVVVWWQKLKPYLAYITLGVVVLALIFSNLILLQTLQSVESPRERNLDSVTTASSTAETCTHCQFYGNDLLFFVPGENPVVIDVSLNRIQEENGTYTQYFFLDGLVDGESVSGYTTNPNATADIEPSGFLTSVERVFAPDNSPREQWSGELLLDNQRYRFSTSEFAGDFIVRSHPEYTQLHSLGTAELNGASGAQQALVMLEETQSVDYRPRVFFPGRDTLESLTYQFVLWDESGNFYLIDDTSVFSDTPAYPEHSWLLFAGADGKTKQKSFSSSVVEGDGQWLVSAPEFAGASFTLDETHMYRKTGDGRTWYVVTGSVVDSSGTRSVSGILRKSE